MKTNKILIVVVVIFALFSILFLSKKSDDNMMVEKNMEKQDMNNENSEIVNDVGDMQDQNKTMVKGSYEVYSPEKLVKADIGRVVLFFRASWCPTCKALDSNLKTNLDNIPEGIIILDVDYDNSAELKKKYGVTYQHTLVEVDSKGNMLKKWSGGETLDSVIKNLNK